ncbi:MAG: preprotein translocase subunit SecY [Armatimonadetes bacterium]|nr:preprotein translocase subunit SecY [Armatimonadota bacterium]
MRARILFVLAMFGVFVLGVHIPVPIPGISSAELSTKLQSNAFFDLINTFGGGALRRISIFSLGLNPYITASIIMQILTQSSPAAKKEMQEGGQDFRNRQAKKTRLLSLALCFLQGSGFLQMFSGGLGHALSLGDRLIVLSFWTAGAMFILWLGEQITERGIGNGVSLMIFAGIIVSLPNQTERLWQGLQDGVVAWWQVAILVAVFLASTWFTVFFTIAQRRIPVQHMRRNIGTKVVGGRTSYLPFTLNLVGVIPIIFAISLMYLPAQFASMAPRGSVFSETLMAIGEWLNPLGRWPKNLVACGIYTTLIFAFSYFYTAVQYNVEDIADNLKRQGSMVPGVRPGKQTRDFLDGVLSRITFMGAVFLAIIALVQYVGPAITGVYRLSIIGGTTLLIVVSVALETMRQIESNLLMKQYGS